MRTPLTITYDHNSAFRFRECESNPDKKCSCTSHVCYTTQFYKSPINAACACAAPDTLGKKELVTYGVLRHRCIQYTKGYTFAGLDAM
jgi:hypothetical protein